jgi:biopolymer transport protein ExbD
VRLPPLPVRTPIEPTLALINVVFLLLLFFVVTGTIVYQHDRSIVPPTSIALHTGKAPIDAVYVDAEGQLRFRGEAQSAADIAHALRADSGQGAGQGAGHGASQGADQAAAAIVRPIQVVADRRLRAQALLAVLADLKDEGLQSLSIVTVRDEGP